MPVCHGHDAGYARAETLCVEVGSVKLGDGNKGTIARRENEGSAEHEEQAL